MKFLLKAKGLFRTLASIAATAAGVAPVIPVFAPYTDILAEIAAVLGGLGLARAGARAAAEKK